MLNDTIKGQLATWLQKLTHPVELVASLDESDKSRELAALLDQIAELSPLLHVRRDDDASARKPSFAIVSETSADRVRFAGIPLGHELTSLVLALLHAGGHRPKLSDAQIEQVRALEGDFEFETWFSLSCQNCPETVQSLNVMSVLNPRIRHVAIDGALFQEEAQTRSILSVPTVFLNGEVFDQGRMTVEEILARLDTGAGARMAADIDAKAPFEVLVVGGGPGGAAAAIYAARKGIRTGLVAERLGGQVLDTMAIENFISVDYTEGPKLGAALEAHVGSHAVDVMNLQRATGLIPAAESASGLIEVRLESGATLRSRTVILATGARWRQLGVPGEDTYRNKGVAYCPHCDGPLYKGKRVAVIGGGNSGIEAAIDLAGIAAHVTVIEFTDTLRADAVLLRKLESLANVAVIRNAQSTEVSGNGQQVTALHYRDRISGTAHECALDGIFVQIGLLPNTEWLQDTLERTAHGEITIDARGATSLPGVFAAGDATTVPYKQIVIAMGAGSTAALSAFDHLIRHDDISATANTAAA